MDERPFPHGPLPQPPPSRRGFVIAGVVTLVAAGGGVALGLSTGRTDEPELPVTELRELGAAASAETALIAKVDAALRGAGGSRAARLRAVRADHVAHLAAINASIVDARYPDTSASSSPSRPSPPPTGRVPLAEVRFGELAASRAAGARAGRLTGRSAVLLASIAAAEAAHAELLR